MNSFSNVLKELMKEKSINVMTLTKFFGFTDPSTTYRWLNGKLNVKLSTAVKMADLFNCSLEYLFGRSSDHKESSYSECPPFDIQFRKILKEQKVTQLRLLNDKVVSGGNLGWWLRKKRSPHIECVIRLADYFNVTIDYMAGREVVTIK